LLQLLRLSAGLHVACLALRAGGLHHHHQRCRDPGVELLRPRGRTEEQQNCRADNNPDHGTYPLQPQ